MQLNEERKQQLVPGAKVLLLPTAGGRFHGTVKSFNPLLDEVVVILDKSSEEKSFKIADLSVLTINSNTTG